MTTTNLTRATVVLVHAAWADASSLNKIIQLLQMKGIQVVAVQIPLTSLSDDVVAVRRVLKRVSGPAVLVGHSYGGAVRMAAGSEDVNVKALVYIAAMAPDEGEPSANCYTEQHRMRARRPLCRRRRVSLDAGRWFRQSSRSRESCRRRCCDGGDAEADCCQLSGGEDDQTSMEGEAFLVSCGGKGSNDSSRHSAIYGA